MWNVDYTRRLKTSGIHSNIEQKELPRPHSLRPKSPFALFIGSILLFTGGMVVGLHLNQTEEGYRKNSEQNSLALRNVAPDGSSSLLGQERNGSRNPAESRPKVVDRSLQEGDPTELGKNSNREPVPGVTDRTSDSGSLASVSSGNGLGDSTAFFPKNLKSPPKMDQINYLIEVGAYEPAESARVGKLILAEIPEFRGRIFRTSTGKLFAGYFYQWEEAKRALETLRGFEKDDFTTAELKTIRF
jgi:hypothetical protein